MSTIGQVIALAKDQKNAYHQKVLYDAASKMLMADLKDNSIPHHLMTDQMKQMTVDLCLYGAVASIGAEEHLRAKMFIAMIQSLSPFLPTHYDLYLTTAKLLKEHSGYEHARDVGGWG